jgi:DNA-binding transcriptional ArsR family regulator
MIGLKSKIAQETLAYFFLHEEVEMYVSELARRLDLDSGNLTRKLIELENAGILKSEQRGMQKYYSLNPSFPLLKEYRQITLKSIGLEHLLKETLKQVPGLKKALLFGSYAENRMDIASDIDLLALGNHKALDLQKTLANIQKKTDREINVVNMTEAEYEKRKRSDAFLVSIQRKKHISLL